MGVFSRTNAVAGDYADASARISPDVNPYTPVDHDSTAPTNLYVWVSDGVTAKFVKSGSTPGDWSDSETPDDTFTAGRQETYEWRKALDDDTDHDGLPNPDETACGTTTTNPDSDGDGIVDGTERGWCEDTDGDQKINALDEDSDNDGLADGVEDADKNGLVDAGETDGLDQDTDDDGIQDGTEAGITFATDTDDTCEDQTGDCNGAWEFTPDGHSASTTDGLVQDTDDDNLDDGLELGITSADVTDHTTTCEGSCTGMWSFSPDTESWTTTLPLDIDSDDDGIADGVEDSDLDGKYDSGETNATTNDTDGDRLADGLELGVTTPTRDTDLTRFVYDRSPYNTTDPEDTDTDGDGLTDDQEDWNLDGTWSWGTNETDASNWDSDHDGLCDGNCSGKGEDLNLNGWRDQDAGGDWTETDPIANDSDVDGILDGDEVNGTYCFREGSCANQAHPLDPLDPDTDDDGLGDGQETAGWGVATWREVSMEAIDNWNVTSFPWDDDSEDDGNSDFIEFQNGSDPHLADTDGDGYSDWDEANQPGANVTGWYNRPPRIENWDVTKHVEDGIMPYFGSGHWVITVEFDAWALHGIGNWQVVYGVPRLTDDQQAEYDALVAGHEVETIECRMGFGGESDLCNAINDLVGLAPIDGVAVADNEGGNTSVHLVARFDATVEEVHIRGKWLEARLWDVYGLGVSKKVQVKSTLEVIVDFMRALADAIAEAVSFLISIITAIIKGIIDYVIQPVVNAINGFLREFANLIGQLGTMTLDDAAARIFSLLVLSAFAFAIFGIIIAISVAEKIAIGATAGMVALVGSISSMVTNMIIGVFALLILGELLGGGLKDLLYRYLPEGIYDILQWSFEISALILLVVLKLRAFKPIKGIETALNAAIVGIVLLGISSAIAAYCGTGLLCLIGLLAVDLIVLGLAFGATQDLRYGRGIGGVKVFYPFLLPATEAMVVIVDVLVIANLVSHSAAVASCLTPGSGGCD